MPRSDRTLSLLTLAAVILVIAAGRMQVWPGDLAVTRLVQLRSPGFTWAEALTKTASAPWSVMLAALCAAISGWMGGWRMAAAVALAFGSMWTIGEWVKPLIGRPRPPAALVRVIGSPKGFSFPSTFALVYSTTIGAVALVAALWSRRQGQGAIVATCVVLLLLGGLARITLGAHWPSDIVATYGVGLVWSAILLRTVAGPPPHRTP
jgi:membrane-associated phospholipid phosphatase